MRVVIELDDDEPVKRSVNHFRAREDDTEEKQDIAKPIVSFPDLSNLAMLDVYKEIFDPDDENTPIMEDILKHYCKRMEAFMSKIKLYNKKTGDEWNIIETEIFLYDDPFLRTIVNPKDLADLTEKQIILGKTFAAMTIGETGKINLVVFTALEDRKTAIITKRKQKVRNLFTNIRDLLLVDHGEPLKLNSSIACIRAPRLDLDFRFCTDQKEYDKMSKAIMLPFRFTIMPQLLGDDRAVYMWQGIMDINGRDQLIETLNIHILLYKRWHMIFYKAEEVVDPSVFYNGKYNWNDLNGFLVAFKYYVKLI